MFKWLKKLGKKQNDSSAEITYMGGDDAEIEEINDDSYRPVRHVSKLLPPTVVTHEIQENQNVQDLQPTSATLLQEYTFAGQESDAIRSKPAHESIICRPVQDPVIITKPLQETAIIRPLQECSIIQAQKLAKSGINETTVQPEELVDMGQESLQCSYAQARKLALSGLKLPIEAGSGEVEEEKESSCCECVNGTLPEGMSYPGLDLTNVLIDDQKLPVSPTEANSLYNNTHQIVIPKSEFKEKVHPHKKGKKSSHRKSPTHGIHDFIGFLQDGLNNLENDMGYDFNQEAEFPMDMASAFSLPFLDMYAKRIEPEGEIMMEGNQLYDAVRGHHSLPSKSGKGKIVSSKTTNVHGQVSGTSSCQTASKQNKENQLFVNEQVSVDILESAMHGACNVFMGKDLIDLYNAKSGSPNTFFVLKGRLAVANLADEHVFVCNNKNWAHFLVEKHRFEDIFGAGDTLNCNAFLLLSLMKHVLPSPQSQSLCTPSFAWLENISVEPILYISCKIIGYDATKRILTITDKTDSKMAQKLFCDTNYDCILIGKDHFISFQEFLSLPGNGSNRPIHIVCKEMTNPIEIRGKKIAIANKVLFATSSMFVALAIAGSTKQECYVGYEYTPSKRVSTEALIGPSLGAIETNEMINQGIFKCKNKSRPNPKGKLDSGDGGHSGDDLTLHNQRKNQEITLKVETVKTSSKSQKVAAGNKSGAKIVPKTSVIAITSGAVNVTSTSEMLCFVDAKLPLLKTLKRSILTTSSYTCTWAAVQHSYGVVRSGSLIILVSRHTFLVNGSFASFDLPLSEYWDELVHAILAPLCMPVRIWDFNITHLAVVAWQGKKPDVANSIVAQYNTVVSAVDTPGRILYLAHLLPQEKPATMKRVTYASDKTSSIDALPNPTSSPNGSQLLAKSNKLNNWQCGLVDCDNDSAVLQVMGKMVVATRENLFMQGTKVNQVESLGSFLSTIKQPSLGVMAFELARPMQVLGYKVTHGALVTYIGGKPANASHIVEAFKQRFA